MAGSWWRRAVLALFVLGVDVPVALADIVVVVNPKNPVRVLNSDHVARIFSGTLRSFPSTGLAATALDQPSSSPIFASFYQHILKATPEKMKRRRAAYLFSGQGVIPLTLENDEAVKATIKERPSAIGYISADSVDKSVVVVYRVPE